MRRVPSNRMPPKPRPVAWDSGGATWACLTCVAFVAAAVAFLAWLGALLQVLIYGFVLLAAGWMGGIWSEMHARRLRLARPKDSICTFARGFNYRATDTWIIRAVYEALQPEVSFPIRSTDRFAEELCIDVDDLDDAIFDEVAFRAGRSTENCEQNPMYGQIKTVADVVAFFSHQPRVSPR